MRISLSSGTLFTYPLRKVFEIARDVGFDRSLVGAYGQDDRASAYTSLQAVLAIEEANRPTRLQSPDQQAAVVRSMSRRNILLRRKGGDALRVDLVKFLATGDERWNPYLREGDAVILRRLSEGLAKSRRVAAAVVLAMDGVVGAAASLLLLAGTIEGFLSASNASRDCRGWQRTGHTQSKLTGQRHPFLKQRCAF